MSCIRTWYLHYDFGIHHVYIKVEFEEVWKIIDDLVKEFEIHNEFDGSGRLNEIWIEDYQGNKHVIAYSK